jgi:type I restriction enzyme R subunit
VAADILHHFTERTATLAGKAMVVCMVRANCVKLFDALKALPGCPEVKVVMTGDLGDDPPQWSKDGHLTTKIQRDAIKARMVDPEDPLKIAIVCDMWLTGTDIPCLHTLYLDKPLRGHSMIQAISRVNRVFKDKPHGLVVDYIGIADELREATDKYTGGGGTGDPAPDVEQKGVPLFLACLDEARQTLPPGKPYAHWRTLSPIEFEDLHVDTYGWLTDDDHRRDAFLQAEARLSPAFVLVQHVDSCQQYADEVLFCQRVRKQVNKVLPPKPKKTLEAAVRDIVDAHVESEGVVDIFALSGVQKPDISILDDAFLQTFNGQPHENLRLKLLERLLNDEIHAKAKRNLAKAKSFRDLLAATMDKYHKRIIDAAAVVQAMLDIKQEIDAEAARAAALGMSAEEVAFYDAIHDNYATVYEEPLLRDLVHDVVRAIKGELKVDWTEPHRQAVRSAVLAAVRRVLRKKGVKEADLEPLVAKVVTQAVELWKHWPMAA